MTKYRVQATKATFGVGMRLRLSDAQSSVRVLSLLKRGNDIFEVRHPVEFKQGEIIEVMNGNISRLLEGHLQIINEDKQSSQQQIVNANNNGSDFKIHDSSQGGSPTSNSNNARKFRQGK